MNYDSATGVAFSIEHAVASAIYDYDVVFAEVFTPSIDGDVSVNPGDVLVADDEDEEVFDNPFDTDLGDVDVGVVVDPRPEPEGPAEPTIAEMLLDFQPAGSGC